MWKHYNMAYGKQWRSTYKVSGEGVGRKGGVKRQARESSRNAGGSWMVLAQVLKWGWRRAKSRLRTGGLAEEWCQDHPKGLKRSGGKSQPLFFLGNQGNGHWVSRDNRDNNHTGAGREVWGREGGLPQWKRVMAGNCRRSLLTTEHSFIGLRR